VAVAVVVELRVVVAVVIEVTQVVPEVPVIVYDPTQRNW
jgi:hypothetical protein